jgi:hypothetical protein
LFVCSKNERKVWEFNLSPGFVALSLSWLRSSPSISLPVK